MDFIDKYNLKAEGMELEKQNPVKAIEFYKNLLDNEYFLNDFWPYRRLVLMFKKTKDFESKTRIIKDFFKSGIYVNEYQYLWFKHKLQKMADKGFIEGSEIDDITSRFRTESASRKNLENTPFPIADRLRKRGEKIILLSESTYDKKQKQYACEEKTSELNRQKRYGEYIDLLNHMIDDMGYNQYRYFQKLCIAYRRVGDCENELKIIERYFNGDSTRTKVSDEWFKSRAGDFEDELKISSDPVDSQNPPIYEYDKSLSVKENLKRKYALIQYGNELYDSKQFNDAILYYKYLTNNTYFSNDCYPYRRLCELYLETCDYNACIISIKKLLTGNIYLNNYQFIWFSERIRQITEKIDVNEYKLKEWMNYYDSHGALSEKKLNRFPADKFIEKNGEITVMSDDEFDHAQECLAEEEIGLVYERVGNYGLALNHYRQIIDMRNFNSPRVHQRMCICAEKLNDYQSELEAVMLYYKSSKRNDECDGWFLKRLEKVNEKLNTDYTIDDLIIKKA